MANKPTHPGRKQILTPVCRPLAKICRQTAGRLPADCRQNTEARGRLPADCWQKTEARGRLPAETADWRQTGGRLPAEIKNWFLPRVCWCFFLGLISAGFLLGVCRNFVFSVRRLPGKLVFSKKSVTCFRFLGGLGVEPCPRDEIRRSIWAALHPHFPSLPPMWAVR